MSGIAARVVALLEHRALGLSSPGSSGFVSLNLAPTHSKAQVDRVQRMVWVDSLGGLVTP